MSLYNMLFGRNPASRLLLAMLGLTEGDVGRFRDCYLTQSDPETPDAPPKPENPLRIAIYTRNGGGNREDYEEATEALRALPTFVTDFDDDFDCTYATYVFDVPEKFKETALELSALGAKSDEPPMARFKRLIENMQKGKEDDPDVKKAMEVGKNIFAQVEEQIAKGGGKVEV